MGFNKVSRAFKIKKFTKNDGCSNPYNLLNRTYEVGLAEISVREQSGLLAYSPLAFGYPEENIEIIICQKVQE